MNIQDQLKRALSAQKQGRFSEAEQQYLVVFNAGYQNEAILNALVDVSTQLNDANKTAAYLDRLCLLLPQELIYCERLAALCARAEQWKAASDCYKRFIENNKGVAIAHYNYAFNLKRAGLYEEALQEYQIALNYETQEPEEVLTNMAVICSDYLRQDERAVEFLHSALAKKGDYIPALYNLASLYEDEGDKRNAARYFQRVVKLDRKNHQALARMAQLSNFSHADDTEIKRMRDILISDDVDPNVRINLNYALAKALDDCADYDRAFEYYLEANRLDSLTMQAYDQSVQTNFIDENIRFFSRSWFNELTPISDESPIFICGMFRSGSTLSEQILASHPDITAGGERMFFFKEATGRLAPFPTSMGGMGAKQLNEIAIRYTRELKNAFPNAGLITDKRPDNFLYIGLIKSLYPKAKIIHTVRNPIDNCLSVFFLRLAPVMNYATKLTDIAHFYQQQVRLTEYWKTLFAESFYQLNYDCLIEEPRENTEAVLDFLGLSWSDACMNFHELKNRVKTASVWQVRQPLYQSSSGRWRNYASHIDILTKQFEKQ